MRQVPAAVTRGKPLDGSWTIMTAHSQQFFFGWYRAENIRQIFDKFETFLSDRLETTLSAKELF